MDCKNIIGIFPLLIYINKKAGCHIPPFYVTGLGG